MPKATKTLIIYRPGIKAIVAEVETGDNYYLSGDDARYYGTMEQFKTAHPEYRDLQDVVNETLKPNNYETE